ncbi:MAG: anti-sigma factor, partial [Pseudomonadota bacterium]|nr:anti-sigma factor [Pseudomonadota bacterium]
GVFAPDKATSLSLRPDLLASLSANAVLAVSIEPPGGSPTGQPTGPVIGKGAISGA